MKQFEVFSRLKSYTAQPISELPAYFWTGLTPIHKMTIPVAGLAGAQGAYPFIEIRNARYYIPEDGFVIRNAKGMVIEVVSSRELGERYHASAANKSEKSLWYWSEDGIRFDGTGWNNKADAITEYVEEGGKKSSIWLAKGSGKLPEVRWPVVIGPVLDALGIESLKVGEEWEKARIAIEALLRLAGENDENLFPTAIDIKSIEMVSTYEASN